MKPRSRATVAAAPWPCRVKQGSTLPVMGTARSKPLIAAGATPALRMINQATAMATNTRQSSSTPGMRTAAAATCRRGMAKLASTKLSTTSSVACQADQGHQDRLRPRLKKATLAASKASHQGQRKAHQAKVSRCAMVAGRHTRVARAMDCTVGTGLANITKPVIGPAIMGKPPSVPPTAWPKRRVAKDATQTQAATSASLTRSFMTGPG